MQPETTPEKPSTTNLEAARILTDLFVKLAGEQINEVVADRLMAHKSAH